MSDDDYTLSIGGKEYEARKITLPRNRGVVILFEFENDAPVVMPTGEGIDVSKWQGVIDWPAVTVRWAFMRATTGATRIDEQFARNWSESKKAGKLRGAYHYFIITESGKAQAQKFIATLGGDFGELPPVLDIEPRKLASGEYETPTSKAALESELQVWLTEVENATGMRPMIYTNKWALALLTTQPKWMGEYPLWVARYSATPPSPSSLPTAWTEWTCWQYTSTGTEPGIIGNVDRNRWKP